MLSFLFGFLPLSEPNILTEDGDMKICCEDEVIRRSTNFPGFPVEVITLRTFLEVYCNGEDAEIWSAI